MKILLTGASSFTGYWFTRELVQAGHHIVAPLRGRDLEAYRGVRRERVRRLLDVCEIHWGVAFGSDRFLELLAGSVDVLCHHAARVDDYKSLDFDVVRAVSENTCNIRRVIEVGRTAGLQGLMLTGSVFEADEGIGESPRRAFSPYGLSKSLSFQVIRYWAESARLPCAKFVISNPFGPYEEPRFCSYLMKCWMQGETAIVRTPQYLRDNIHVSLLSKAYAAAVARLEGSLQSFSTHPSGYAESQASFASRFALEIGTRLGLACPLIFGEQTDFSEPLIRLNCERLDPIPLAWDEKQAWDELADYYRQSISARS